MLIFWIAFIDVFQDSSRFGVLHVHWQASEPHVLSRPASLWSFEISRGSTLVPLAHGYQALQLLSLMIPHLQIQVTSTVHNILTKSVVWLALSQPKNRGHLHSKWTSWVQHYILASSNHSLVWRHYGDIIPATCLNTFSSKSYSSVVVVRGGALPGNRAVHHKWWVRDYPIHVGLSRCTFVYCHSIYEFISHVYGYAFRNLEYMPKEAWRWISLFCGKNRFLVQLATFPYAYY